MTAGAAASKGVSTVLLSRDATVRACSSSESSRASASRSDSFLKPAWFSLRTECAFQISRHVPLAPSEASMASYLERRVAAWVHRVMASQI